MPYPTYRKEGYSHPRRWGNMLVSYPEHKPEVYQWIVKHSTEQEISRLIAEHRIAVGEVYHAVEFEAEIDGRNMVIGQKRIGRSIWAKFADE